MAIDLEVMNLIVPIAVIELKYPGGWARCCADHGLDEAPSAWGPCWHDGELFRDGAMSDFDLAMKIDTWESMGFKRTRRRNGVRITADICLYGTFADGPAYPCDWIDIDVENATACYKAPPPRRRRQPRAG